MIKIKPTLLDITGPDMFYLYFQYVSTQLACFVTDHILLYCYLNEVVKTSLQTYFSKNYATNCFCPNILPIVKLYNANLKW